MEDPKEQKKPAIPTLKDAQKPQVKIKGLAGATSLIERLKQFKKKDLAFMAAGLGVLFMTPIAEHYMMSPEGGDKGFQPGFGARGGVFGSGGSPYEGGVTGMAPGGPTGGGDVITPLNVRDPSALVMGPNSSQQPPATATTPPPPPSKSDSSDWKDALANSASKAASEATKKASLPVPKPAMANAGLRGLGAATGGGGGSYTLPAISAGNVPNRGTGSNALSQVRPAPGFKGVTRGGAPQGSLENLKKAAASAGSDLNRAGSAAGNLESAASHQMPTGSASEGGGGPGAGGADKGVGGSQDKGSKSLGESLEFLRMKEEQSKEIDLRWKLKEKKAMRWPNIADKMAEEMAMAPVKGLSTFVADAFKNLGAGKSKKLVCTDGGYWEMPKSELGDSAPNKDQEWFWTMKDGKVVACTKSVCPAKTGCAWSEGTETAKKKDTDEMVGGVGGAYSEVAGGSGRTLKQICADADALIKEVDDAKAGAAVGDAPKIKEIATALKTMVKDVNSAQSDLTGKSDLYCDAVHNKTDLDGTSIWALLNESVKTRMLDADGVAVRHKKAFDQAVFAAQTTRTDVPAKTDPIVAALKKHSTAGLSEAEGLAKGAYTESYQTADGSLNGQGDRAGAEAEWAGLDPKLKLLKDGLPKIRSALAQTKTALDRVDDGAINAKIKELQDDATEVKISLWVTDVINERNKALSGPVMSLNDAVESEKKLSASVVELEKSMPKVRELINESQAVVNNPSKSCAPGDNCSGEGLQTNYQDLVSWVGDPSKGVADISLRIKYPVEGAPGYDGLKAKADAEVDKVADELKNSAATIQGKAEQVVTTGDGLKTTVNTAIPKGQIYYIPTATEATRCVSVGLEEKGVSPCIY